jgi:hypothetical protein
MPIRHQATWRALKEGPGGEQDLDSFEGTREEAVEWAKQRPGGILIYDEEVRDLVVLRAFPPKE